MHFWGGGKSVVGAKGDGGGGVGWGWVGEEGCGRADVVVECAKRRARRGPNRRRPRTTCGWTPRDAEAYAKEQDVKVEELKRQAERTGEQKDQTTKCHRLDEAVVEVAARHQVPAAEKGGGGSHLDYEVVEQA